MERFDDGGIVPRRRRKEWDRHRQQTIRAKL